MAASEKVALAYHAFNRIKEESDVASMIVSDISSNTVTIAIKDGRFFGAIDACLGASGLLHGPLDLDDIRRVDASNVTANKAFYSSGVSQKAGIDSDDILNGKSRGENVARDALVMTTEMEISGLAGIVKPQIIAIAGSAGVHENIFDKLKSEIEGIAPVFKLHSSAAAIGAAEIARDVLKGNKNFLGIGVDL
jgi:putative methanogenesis marker protein 12